MKSFKLLLSVLALAALAAAPALRAQDAPAATPPAKGQHAGGGELGMLTKHLSLTADQQAKIGPILADQQKALEALKADTTVTAKDKGKKMRDIRESHKAQIMPLLTPDQQTKYKDMGQRMKKHAPKSDAPATSTTAPAPTN